MARVAKISNRNVKMRGRKAKTWGKGHSSDSNPKITKFRDMAAQSRFVINEEPSKNSTRKKVRFDESKNILKNNENLLEKLTLDDKDDDKSSVESAETNFTTFTNCTNPTFNKVHRLWTSGSDLQNEVLAVLAAVAEVIKSSGEQETEIAYFGALSNSLATLDGQNLKTLAATTYLLSLVIKKVSDAVLRSCFSTLSPVFCRNLNENSSNPDSNALVKYTVECLGVLLKAQSCDIWENSSMERILRDLLHFTIDRRPKIRKTCQKVLLQIIFGSKVHPASKIYADFCSEVLDKNDDYAKNSILHFLQQCMANFGENSFKICAEKILNSVDMNESTLQLFENVFFHQPKLSRELILQLIAVFYDLQPSPKNDQFTFSAWCKVQTNLHICLSDDQSRAAFKFSEILIQNLGFMTEKSTISIGVQAIKTIFEHFLPREDKNLAENLVNCLKNVLNLKYMQIWPECFGILSLFFQLCPKNDINFEILLKSLAELREMDENSQFLQPLNRCLGSAIKFLGPEIVLRSISLDLDVSKPSVQLGQVSNSWILPLLRQNIEKTNLEHFNREFLPKVLAISSKIGHSANDKILQVLESQIWELLPSYCIDPQDFDESFKKIGPFLVKFLVEKPNLRLIILSSLRNLILKSSTTNMANYSEHFLPVIINLFISDNEQIIGYDLKGVRQACLETLRIFLKITPRETIARFLDLAITKFEQFTVDQKHRCLDVQIALSPYLSGEEMSRLWQFLQVFFQDKDKSLQKKAYRVLEECFKEDSQECRIFFDKNREQILEMLNSKSQTSSSTKASKIRCLNKLFENGCLEVELLLDILPNVILHLQELNVKTRRSSAIFFISGSNLLINKYEDLERASEIIWGKLGSLFDDFGNPDHVTCCLIAARLFIFEFKHQTPGSILSQFLSKIKILLSHKNRKIVQSSLEFLKTFVVFSSQVQLGQYLEIFLPAIYSQNEDCRRHFRFLTRKILAKLMRKIPYELISKFVPDEDGKKQLNSVRKALARYERRKSAAKNGASGQEFDDQDDDALSGVTGISRPETIADLLKDDDDDDNSSMDENFDRKSQKSTTSRKTAAPVFLRETADEILDFTDLKSLTKMSTRNVKKNVEKMDKNRGFKVDDKGRLIIGGENDEGADEENDEVIKLKGKRKNADDFDEIFDSDDEDQILNKKRPKSSGTLVRDEEQDSDLDEALHYRPGGRGIHRNLEKPDRFSAAKKKSGGDSGKSSKNGGLQPYAYVPLDFKQLNKRKRAKASGKFRNLLEGAKKGAKRATKKSKNIKR